MMLISVAWTTLLPYNVCTSFSAESQSIKNHGWIPRRRMSCTACVLLQVHGSCRRSLDRSLLEIKLHAAVWCAYMILIKDMFMTSTAACDGCHYKFYFLVLFAALIACHAVKLQGQTKRTDSVEMIIYGISRLSTWSTVAPPGDLRFLSIWWHVIGLRWVRQTSSSCSNWSLATALQRLKGFDFIAFAAAYLDTRILTVCNSYIITMG